MQILEFGRASGLPHLRAQGIRRAHAVDGSDGGPIALHLLGVFAARDHQQWMKASATWGLTPELAHGANGQGSPAQPVRWNLPLSGSRPGRH